MNSVAELDFGVSTENKSNTDQSVMIPKSRLKRLKKLEENNGMEYSIVRNQQIQIGKDARDYLKEFAAYVGSDGKASRSALDKDGNQKESGGAVHTAVAKQIKAILGFSAKDMDVTGDPEMVCKAALAWAKVKPILMAGVESRLPRKECFAQLWAKFNQIAGV